MERCVTSIYTYYKNVTVNNLIHIYFMPYMYPIIYMCVYIYIYIYICKTKN